MQILLHRGSSPNQEPEPHLLAYIILAVLLPRTHRLLLMSEQKFISVSILILESMFRSHFGRGRFHRDQYGLCLTTIIPILSTVFIL